MKARYPESDFYLVGLSMGGNMLIRWAAENKITSDEIKGIFTLGAPFNLYDSTVELSTNWKKGIYAHAMVRGMMDISRVYANLIKKKGIDIDWGKFQSFNLF